MATSIIIDAVVVSLLIIFALSGLFKGFAKTFISIFGTILSLLFAILLAKTVANFLENSFSLATKLSYKLNGFVEKVFGAEITGMTFGEANENALSNSGLAGWIINGILSLKNDGAILETATLGDIISKMFAYYITIIIAVIVIFILFKIIFFIIGDLIVKARKFNVVNAVDRSLGLLLGIVKGIISVNFILMILIPLPFGFCQTIAVELPNTVVASIVNKIDMFGILLNVIFDPTNALTFLPN
ncbi:MAG: CvpA family protein [Clostridia bacterium]|nr:CvpA family protein [Clostridia bacterium]